MNRQSGLKMALITGALLLAAGCAVDATNQEEGMARSAPDEQAIRASIEALELDPDEFPLLDCSTSAQPMLATVLGTIYDIPASWRPHGRDGSWRMQLTPRESEEGEKVEKHSGITRVVELGVERATLVRPEGGQEILAVSGTHDAYLNIIKGERDLAIIARKPSEDEKVLMKEHGVDLDIQTVALDAFVFIVRPDNPAEDLTLEQVRDIFAGEITHWNEVVDGPERAITPYTRDRNSGSQELMISRVMKDRPFAEHARDDSVVMAMVGPMRAMERDRFGISYSVHYYTRYMAPDLFALSFHAAPRREHETAPPAERTRDVEAEDEAPSRTRMLAIDGVMPGPETIADGSYPLIEPVYLVTRRDLDDDAPAARLRDWLLSPEGQAVVRKSLYVDRDGNAP